MERYFNYVRDHVGDGNTVGVCTVTVYEAGTLTLATIYDDEAGTPKANPFSCDSSSFFYFYAAAGRYDVAFSGSALVAPFVWADIQLIDDFNLVQSDQPNTFTGDQTINGDIIVSGSGTFGGNLLISGGKIPALTSTYFTSLDGSTLINLSASALASGAVPDAVLAGTYASALSFTNINNILAGATLSLGAAPAASGAIRLTLDESISSKSSTGTDIALLKLNTSDVLEIHTLSTLSVIPATDDANNLGATALRYRNGHIKDLYTSRIDFGYTNVASSGAIRLGNGSSYAISFLDAASNTKSVYVDGSSQLVLPLPLLVTGDILPSASLAYDLGSPSAVFAAAHIDEHYANDIYLYAPGGSSIFLRNAADSAYIAAITRNASDQVVLCDATHPMKYDYALGATSGAAAAAIGNITATASNVFAGWVRIIDSTGTAIYIPAWR